MNDYGLLAIIAVLLIGGGLYLLRAARQWRRRRDDTRSVSLDVVRVVANSDFTLWLEFESGERRVFDMTPLMDKQPFVRLKGSPVFMQAFLDYGTVVWPGNVDIAPETLYARSRPV